MGLPMDETNVAAELLDYYLLACSSAVPKSPSPSKVSFSEYLVAKDHHNQRICRGYARQVRDKLAELLPHERNNVPNRNKYRIVFHYWVIDLGALLSPSGIGQAVDNAIVYNDLTENLPDDWNSNEAINWCYIRNGVAYNVGFSNTRSGATVITLASESNSWVPPEGLTITQQLGNCTTRDDVTKVTEAVAKFGSWFYQFMRCQEDPQYTYIRGPAGSERSGSNRTAKSG